jgi:predicted transcriptional regulator
MNTKEVKVNWNEHKRKLVKKFAFLTDNDLALEDGEKEKMLKRLQLEFGMSRDELIRIIAAF